MIILLFVQFEIIIECMSRAHIAHIAHIAIMRYCIQHSVFEGQGYVCVWYLVFIQHSVACVDIEYASDLIDLN